MTFDLLLPGKTNSRSVKWNACWVLLRLPESQDPFPPPSNKVLFTLRTVVENKILQRSRHEHRLSKRYQNLQSSGSDGC